MTYILIGDRVINLMAISTVRVYSPEEGPDQVMISMLSGETLEYSGEFAMIVWEKLSKMATPMEKF